jgi:membrane-associated phospholipid phosphatase
MGDGTVPFLLVFILLLVSFREALAFLSITLILIIIITVLKRVIFPEFDRPVEYFCDSPDIRIIKGYDPPRLYTFPSGHSSTVFSVFLYLAFLAKNKWMKFALFLVALSVSYSRIYLSAHFPADAVAGSLIAVSITLLFYTWSRNFKPLWLDKKIVIAPKFTIR